MSKQIQIDWELFRDLIDYFFSDGAPEGFEADEIRKKMSEKIDKIINRELFTKYKRAPSGAEREVARQAYLNRRGISKSFRTNTEYHEPEPQKKE